MKPCFKYSKFSNYFFFLSNLSEWHFSCRKNYNIIWEKLTPSLVEKTKKLTLFGNILKKYEKWDGNANFPVSARATDLKSITEGMSVKEKKIIEQTFLLFKTEFEKIWKKALPRLKIFLKSFKTKKYQKLIKRGGKMLEVYFGRPTGKKLDIYLLMAPAGERGGGGANIGPNKISVEIGNISDAGIRWISGIILHEASHASYQNKFNDLVRKFTKSISLREYKKYKILKIFNGNFEIAMKELITSSIVGDGIINEIVFGFPSQKHLKEDIELLDWNECSHSSLLRKSASIYLRSINKKYLKNKKQIDIDYLKYTLVFLKKFEEKYKKGKFRNLSFL